MLENTVITPQIVKVYPAGVISSSLKLLPPEKDVKKVLTICETARIKKMIL
jgi:hypothetical protein